MSFWGQLTQPQAVLVAGLVGAVGAIAGALIANVVGQMVGARGLGRRHWEQVRHLAYAEVVEAFHGAWMMYDAQGNPTVRGAEAERRAAALMMAYAKASLLARTQETTRALEALHACAQYLWSRQGRNWSEVEEACYEIDTRFRQSTRKELGMPRITPMPYAEYRRLYELDSPAPPAGSG